MLYYKKKKAGHLALLFLTFFFELYLSVTVLFASPREDFNLLVRYYREKNFPMVKNLAKSLIDKNDYRYHVKLILSEVYFQENDLYYAKELLKELLEEFPEQSKEIMRRLEKVEKEERFLGERRGGATNRFVIYWKDDGERDVLKKVEEILEDAVKAGAKFFKWYPDEKIQVMLYYGSEYRDYTVFPVWSQGGYDGKLRIMITKGMDEELLRELLFHEYAHIAVQYLTNGRCPLWLNEAIAQYFAIKYGRNREINLEKLTTGYDAFPKNWSNLPEEEVKRLYKNSLMIITYIIRASDEGVAVKILEDIGEGKSFERSADEALSVYGLNLEDIFKGGMGN